MTCYCISGLGADHRIFSRLNLPGITLHYLPWLLPADDEPIEAYARRMKAGIRHDNPILIGVSFGGILAVEIAKLYDAATVIQVSSIRNRRQRPAWMTFSGRLHLERLLSQNRYPSRNPIRRWLAPIDSYFLGVETKEDALLHGEYKDQTDPRFLRWAVKRIFHWENEWTPSSFYQLHGGRDRIFHLSAAAVTHFIPEGGHLMIHNRPEPVSDHISAILSGLANR